MENNKLKEAVGWCKVDLLQLANNKQDLSKFFGVAKELNIEFVEYKPSLKETVEEENTPMLDESTKDKERMEAELNYRYGGDLKKSIEVLCNALREDTTEGSYYYSWMCNIKMSFIDSWDNWGEEEYKSNVDDKIVNEIAETAAKNFLNLLINK